MSERGAAICVSDNCDEVREVDTDTQQTGLINFGGDHPRLTWEGKQLLGGIVLIILLVVVAVGFWKQIQAQRKPQRGRRPAVKRVDLMAAVKQCDDSRPTRDEAGKPD